MEPCLLRSNAIFAIILTVKRKLLLNYKYNGRLPEVKNKIIDMALNGSGIRDTARVLEISPTTVIEVLKKRNLSYIM
jgi:transposase-like protein